MGSDNARLTDTDAESNYYADSERSAARLWLSVLVRFLCREAAIS